MCSDYFDCNCKCSKKCCREIQAKRYFLPLVAAPIACIHQPIVNYLYFPMVIGLSAFVLFWNFPKLVYYTASRPLYYEDLFIDEKKLPNYDVDPRLKIKFQKLLEWVLIITNAFLVSALGDYWLYKTIGNFTTLELVGITGGIIKIFQIINNTISRLMLVILKKRINKESLKIRKSQTKQIKDILNIKLNTHGKNSKLNEQINIELVEKCNYNRERLNTI